MTKKLARKIKAIDLLYRTPKFNHDIIGNYHVAWDFFSGTMQTLEEPGDDPNLIIHNVIDLNTLLPISYEDIPDDIEKGINNILIDEEKLMEMICG